MNAAVEKRSFRISTGLKDLIGRDLITNDFVAIFELVKNSFDAHAKTVRLRFQANRIVISDDGKGMSRDDILDKWLFVAYSAKRDGTEDENYRDRIEDRQRPFAGAKGVGRFSCDRLGAELVLSSRARGSSVQSLQVDWTRFERDSHEEFTDVEVALSETSSFPDPSIAPEGTGTVIDIRQLRSKWSRQQLQDLKRELSKLIDPFSDDEPSFRIVIDAPEQIDADLVDAAYNAGRGEDQSKKTLVNGDVRNPILGVLAERTTCINVSVSNDGRSIESALIDRGELVYRIREPNQYPLLIPAMPKASIYFLNRSAKTVFARRMGLPSVQFGSVFLFRNGFRVFPIGAEDDDFFGLNRRKQQGQRRYLGGRDLIGRLDIVGAEGFDEATSRNQGLILTPGVRDLIDFVIEKCVRRLERYVVDITWRDAFDKDVETLERMRLDQSSARISALVSRLAASEGIELLEYNPELVRILDDKSEEFVSSLRALEVLAERTGDKELLRRVDEARDRLAELEASEREAREAEDRATSRAVKAEAAAEEAKSQYISELDRNKFLVAAASLDHDTVLNLHHQIIILASDVHNEITRLVRRLRTGNSITDDEWLSSLETMSFRNSQILTAAKFATKGGYKQQSSEAEDNLPLYIKDYVENVATLWSAQGLKVETNWDGQEFVRRFKPIDVGILIDNLVSNADRAGAGRINFNMKVVKGTRRILVVDVADDGHGWPSTISPLDRVFEKGVTSSTGSGLGLFHVKHVVESMGGSIEALTAPASDALDGAHLIVSIPQ